MFSKRRLINRLRQQRSPGRRPQNQANLKHRYKSRPPPRHPIARKRHPCRPRRNPRRSRSLLRHLIAWNNPCPSCRLRSPRLRPPLRHPSCRRHRRRHRRCRIRSPRQNKSPRDRWRQSRRRHRPAPPPPRLPNRQLPGHRQPRSRNLPRSLAGTRSSRPGWRRARPTRMPLGSTASRALSRCASGWPATAPCLKSHS